MSKIERVLCIFDLDHTLMYINNKSHKIKSFVKSNTLKKPTYSKGSFDFHLRSGREEFIDIAFDPVTFNHKLYFLSLGEPPFVI